MKIGSIISGTSLCILTIFLVTFDFQITHAQTAPVITSVNSIIPNQHQTITITGSGFGNQMPYANQDSPYIEFYDITGNWNAGCACNPSNAVTLDVSEWTDSQIVITGFEGSYGSNNWKLNYGDMVKIGIVNPQTRGSATTYATTVSMDMNTAPSLYFTTPTISGLSVSTNWAGTSPNKIDKAIQDWGDGTTSVQVQNGQVIPNSWIHTYSQGGTYVIKATAIDINGLSGSATQTINLQQQGQPTQTNPTAPSYSQSGTSYVKTDKTEYVVSETSSVQANIYGMVGNPQGGYVNLTLIQPDGTAESLSGYVKGDGSFTLPLVLDTRSQTGMYQVKADYHGSSVGSTSFTVTVGVIGHQTTTPTRSTTSTTTPSSPIQMNIDFKINDLTITPRGAINDPTTGSTNLSIIWDWGDGTTSSGWPTTNRGSSYDLAHTYSSTGQYTITVTATDNLGQTNKYVRTISVNSPSSSTTPSTTATTPSTTSENGSTTSQGISTELLLTIIGLVIAIIAIPLGLYLTRKSEKKIVDRIENSVGHIEDKVVKDAMGTINKDIENIKEESIQDVKKTVKKVRDALDDVSKDL